MTNVAGLRARFDVWSAAAVVLALAAMAFQAVMPTKDDISWLIINAQALIDGKELYKDIVETNPPLSVLLYVPAVLIERLTGLRAELASIALTGLAGLAVARWIRQRLEAAGVEGGSRMEAAAVLVFLVLPLGAYGQKDQIAALIALPFCIELSLQAGNRGRMSVLTGALAGLSMAIKPQFAAAILLPCLWVAARSWWKGERCWPWFIVNRSTVTAGMVVVVFQGLVYLLFPAFFRDVLPAVLEIYVPARRPLLTLLLPMKGFLFIALLAMPIIYGPRTALSEVVAAAGLGFFVAFLVQGKGWPYHLFPATSYGLFLVFGEILPRVWKQRSSRSPVAAILIAAVVLSVHTMWMTVTWTDWSALTRAIVATGIRQPTILNIAASHDVGHPSTRDAGGRWVGTYSCRWLTALATYDAQGEAEGTESEAVAHWLRHDRDVLRRDITEKQPDIILVDRRGDFDWLAWAREDPATALLLDRYVPAAQVADYGSTGHIELLRRESAGNGGSGQDIRPAG